MLDKHVFDALIDRQLLTVLRQLNVWIQQERKLRQNSQFTLDLHPTGTPYERPRMIPLLNQLHVRTQRLQPNVKHLLVESNANQRAEFDVKRQIAMAQVDQLHRAEEQLVWR